MLKKLFKYEWNDCWKLVGGLNLLVVLLSILGRFIYQDSVVEILDRNTTLALLFGLYNVLYFVLIMALALGSTFYFFFRFYRNLYTDEGYLMHTLPVNAHQLIWSKTFVAIIWRLVSVLVMAFAFINFIDNLVRADEGYSIWTEFGSILSDLMSFDIPASAAGIIIFAVLLVLITPFYALFIGYLSVSLGQTFKKHRRGGAIAVYCGLTYALQFVLTFLTAPFVSFFDNLDYISEDQALMRITIFLGVVFVIVAGLTALFYYVTYYVMKNKLNLE